MGGIFLSNLAERLKAFRKRSNLTQQQVADILKIKRSTYAYYETGKTEPKLDTLKSLARLYNTDVDILLDSSIGDGGGNVVSSPDIFGSKDLGESFDMLTDFEQSVLLRVRIMSVDEKKKLIDFLNSDVF